MTIKRPTEKRWPMRKDLGLNDPEGLEDQRSKDKDQRCFYISTSIYRLYHTLRQKSRVWKHQKQQKWDEWSYVYPSRISIGKSLGV